jgi:hypothetical protein
MTGDASIAKAPPRTVEQTCPLCGLAASCRFVPNDSGDLLEVACTRCARYLISPWAASKLTTDYALMRELLAAQARSEAPGFVLVIDEEPTHTPYPVRARRLPECDVPRAAEPLEQPAKASLRIDGDIGQLVQGDVYARQLFFIQGGKAVQLTQLSEDELEKLRVRTRSQALKRDWYAIAPVAIWICIASLTFTGMDALTAGSVESERKAGLFLAMFFSSVVAACMYGLTGTAIRVQRGVAAQHRERIILIAMELDMRRADRPLPPWRERLKEWRDAYRD